MDFLKKFGHFVLEALVAMSIVAAIAVFSPLHAAEKAYQLPEGWFDHLNGQKVVERDLGDFVGEEEWQGAPFFWYKKTYQNRAGESRTCTYAVEKTHLYISDIVICRQ